MTYIVNKPYTPMNQKPVEFFFIDSIWGAMSGLGTIAEIETCEGSVLTVAGLWHWQSIMASIWGPHSSICQK